MTNIGNPLGYYDGTSMTWQNGRQLASLTKSGAASSYVYQATFITFAASAHIRTSAALYTAIP